MHTESKINCLSFLSFCAAMHLRVRTTYFDIPRNGLGFSPQKASV